MQKTQTNGCYKPRTHIQIERERECVCVCKFGVGKHVAYQYYIAFYFKFVSCLFFPLSLAGSQAFVRNERVFLINFYVHIE